MGLIVMMHQGAIVEAGTHEELIALQDVITSLPSTGG